MSQSLSAYYTSFKGRLPGLLVCVVVALAATYVAQEYSLPIMPLALLIGALFHFMAEDAQCESGISFASKSLLRLGVALLGFRISTDLIVGLGAAPVALIFVAMGLTISCTLWLGRILRLDGKLSMLVAGSVSICGASAAMAIASAMPGNSKTEKHLSSVILCVALFSNLAMVLYPIIAQTVGMSDLAAAIFIGGSIHDVAGVVGAGYALADHTGDTAVVVKMLRVLMLAPVIFVVSIAFRSAFVGGVTEPRKAALVPSFVWAFFALALWNSVSTVPAEIVHGASQISTWLLVVAIAGVGMKTSIAVVARTGAKTMFLVLMATVFLATVVALGALWIGV